MHLIKKFRIILLLCLSNLTLAGSDAQAQEFSVANTLQSNMVVQQGEELLVWGNARAGSVVQVKAGWQSAVIFAKTSPEGKWMVRIPVPLIKAGDFRPYSLKITAGTESRTLENILIGDVWLCGGQSNMDMQLKPFLPWLLGAMHYQMEIENARYPQIRLFDVRTDFKAEPMEDCGGYWKVCTPENAADFSALAYFFARELFNRRNIPVGLVVSSVGGSSAQAWMSRDTLDKNTFLYNKYVAAFDTSQAARTPPDSVVTFEKVVMPSFLYNAMIYPLRNLRFSGMLFYQGESNRKDSGAYTMLSASMIRNWRTLLSQPTLPFYYVQVAPYNWQESDTTANEYAYLREAQAAVRDIVPFTEIALTMDIADPTDIHPRNKQDLGYRLAKIALAKKYGHKIVYSGPEYLSHTNEGNVVKLRFKEQGLGSGLATNDGLAPRHFYIAGRDNIFHYAEARIEGNEVWLESSKVSEPVAVRYAFTNFPVTNFGNAEGFPALPFRTDK